MTNNAVTTSGGAVWVENAHVDIRQSVFTNNPGEDLYLVGDRTQLHVTIVNSYVNGISYHDGSALDTPPLQTCTSSPCTESPFTGNCQNVSNGVVCLADASCAANDLSVFSSSTHLFIGELISSGVTDLSMSEEECELYGGNQWRDGGMDGFLTVTSGYPEVQLTSAECAQYGSQNGILPGIINTVRYRGNVYCYSSSWITYYNARTSAYNQDHCRDLCLNNPQCVASSFRVIDSTCIQCGKVDSFNAHSDYRTYEILYRHSKGSEISYKQQGARYCAGPKWMLNYNEANFYAAGTPLVDAVDACRSLCSSNAFCNGFTLNTNAGRCVQCTGPIGWGSSGGYVAEEKISPSGCFVNDNFYFHNSDSDDTACTVTETCVVRPTAGCKVVDNFIQYGSSSSACSASEQCIKKVDFIGDLNTSCIRTEWSCLQSFGRYTLSSDCIASIVLTGELDIHGKHTTITAKPNERHFESQGYVLRLTNLTLTGGYENNGGSISVTNSDLYVFSCTFVNNEAGNDGGAIYLISSSLTASFSSLHSNKAGRNGGSVYSSESTLDLTDMQFLNNTAVIPGSFTGFGASGGAIALFCSTACEATKIKDSIFSNNTVLYGGGAITVQANTVLLVRCQFLKNIQEFVNPTVGSQLESGGGALKVSGSSTKIDVRECLFDQNMAGIHGDDIHVFPQAGQEVKIVNTRVNDVYSVSSSTSSIHTCANSPCSVYPYTGDCTSLAHGVVCRHVSECNENSYSRSIASDLPPKLLECRRVEDKDPFALQTLKQHINTEDCTCLSSRDCLPGEMCIDGTCSCARGVGGPNCSQIIVKDGCLVERYGDEELLFKELVVRTQGLPRQTMQEARCEQYALSLNKTMVVENNGVHCFVRMYEDVVWGTIQECTEDYACIELSADDCTYGKVQYSESGQELTSTECEEYAEHKGSEYAHNNGTGCYEHGSSAMYGKHVYGDALPAYCKSSTWVNYFNAGITGITVEECKQVCMDNPDCVAMTFSFVYNKCIQCEVLVELYGSGVIGYESYEKKEVFPVASDVAWIDRGASYCQTARWGFDYNARQSVESIDECKELCALNPHCGAATIIVLSNECIQCGQDNVFTGHSSYYSFQKAPSKLVKKTPLVKTLTLPERHIDHPIVNYLKPVDSYISYEEQTSGLPQGILSEEECRALPGYMGAIDNAAPTGCYKVSTGHHAYNRMQNSVPCSEQTKCVVHNKGCCTDMSQLACYTCVKNLTIDETCKAKLAYKYIDRGNTYCASASWSTYYTAGEVGSTIEECQQKCSDNPLCRAITFRLLDARCIQCEFVQAFAGHNDYRSFEKELVLMRSHIVKKTHGVPSEDSQLSKVECRQYAESLNTVMTETSYSSGGCVLQGNNVLWTYRQNCTSELICLQNFRMCTFKTCDGIIDSRKHMDKCGQCDGLDDCMHPLNRVQRNLLNTLSKEVSLEAVQLHDIMPKPSTKGQVVTLINSLFYLLYDSTVLEVDKRLRIDVGKNYTTPLKKSLLQARGLTTVDLVTLTGSLQQSPRIYQKKTFKEFASGRPLLTVDRADCARYAELKGYVYYGDVTWKGGTRGCQTVDVRIWYGTASSHPCGTNGFKCIELVLADTIDTFEGVSLENEAISFHKYSGPLVVQRSDGLEVYEVDHTGQERVNIVYNRRLLDASVGNMGVDLTEEECRLYAARHALHFLGSGDFQPDPDPYPFGCLTSSSGVRFQTNVNSYSCGDACHEEINSGAPSNNMNENECRAFGGANFVAAGAWNYAKGCIKAGAYFYYNTLDTTLHCGTYGITCVQKRLCAYQCVKDPTYYTPTHDFFFTNSKDITVSSEVCEQYATANKYVWGGVYSGASGCVLNANGEMEYGTNSNPCTDVPCLRKNDQFYVSSIEQQDTSINGVTEEECGAYASASGITYSVTWNAESTGGCIFDGASAVYNREKQNTTCTVESICVKRNSTARTSTMVAVDDQYTWTHNNYEYYVKSSGNFDLSATREQCANFADINGMTYHGDVTWRGGTRGCQSADLRNVYFGTYASHACGNGGWYCIEVIGVSVVQNTLTSGSMLVYSDPVPLLACTLDGDGECTCPPEYFLIVNQCVRDTITNCTAGYQLYAVDGFSDDSICVDVDECLTNPCQNGGVCTNSIGSYLCTCAVGFTGVNCELNIDDCALTPCLHGGVCTDLLNAVDCDCTGTGYHGYRCDNDINDCAVDPCLNGGTCTDQTGGYTCTCTSGFFPPICEDFCNPNPCLNGVCENTATGYACTCEDGWEGTNCEASVDDCIGVTCLNGGACVDKHLGYECNCAPGWEGTHCETNIDECASATCANGGTCVDQVAGFVCNCLKGYGGTLCEINLCNPNPCARGTCLGLSGDYECWCPTGYNGKNCEVNIDECAANPCVRGTCVDLLSDYQCNCPAGYEGKNCEVDIDDCAAEPCKNGGTCTDNVNGFTCQCTGGYSGPTCEVDNDECATSPCENGGTCRNIPGDFECECAPGWGSKRCDVEINECDANPCKNGGTCTDLFNDFRCNCSLTNHTGKDCTECPSDFEGVDCETPIDYCNPMPCKHGLCTNVKGGYVCNCTSGYIGKNCDSGLSIVTVVSIYIVIAGMVAGIVVFFLIYCGVIQCGEKPRYRRF